MKNAREVRARRSALVRRPAPRGIPRYCPAAQRAIPRDGVRYALTMSTEMATSP